MQIIKGKLDYRNDGGENVALLFTANRVVKTNGRLVMGKGNAKACVDAFPDIDLVFGNIFRTNPTATLVGMDTEHKGLPHQLVYAFVVKEHWRQPADINLVIKATGQLSALAEHNPYTIYKLPFPAIGAGGLSRHDVLMIIQDLPDNVKVYEA